jgi:hypothetical protein
LYSSQGRKETNMGTTNFRRLRLRARRGDAGELAAPSHEPVAAAGDEYLDALELRDAILGHGVVLNETPGGGFVLHLVTAGHVRPLGWFSDAAAAWGALDALDDWAAGRDHLVPGDLSGVAAPLL